MKIFSLFLALLTALPSPARAQEAVAPLTSAVEPTVSTAAVEGPFTVTAPRVKDQAALETARATGAGAAVAGTGLMAYAAFSPPGAQSRRHLPRRHDGVFSHRRLHGERRFSSPSARPD